MKLKWYGHASFRITDESGTAIITDPYTPETAGYSPITEPPDIVITSSDNDSFHCRADLIPGDFVTINALKVALSGEEIVVKGIPIRAIAAMEALDHPEHDPDQNGMYRFVVDGIHVGHIGDLGNPFSKKQIEFFQGVDVFLVLAGGLPTIKLPDLKTAIEAIRPRLVVPMHFRTLSYKPRNTLWIESFLSFFDDHDVDFACHYEATLTREELPEPTRILVLDYVKR
jgi:L-ascorbate metabolism protein UlaG (beta-lactamase superfamily)